MRRRHKDDGPFAWDSPCRARANLTEEKVDDDTPEEERNVEGDVGCHDVLGSEDTADEPGDDGRDEAMEGDGKRSEQTVKVFEDGLKAGRVSGTSKGDGLGCGEREVLGSALILSLLGSDLGSGTLGDGCAGMLFRVVAGQVVRICVDGRWLRHRSCRRSGGARMEVR